MKDLGWHDPVARNRASVAKVRVSCLLLIAALVLIYWSSGAIAVLSMNSFFADGDVLERMQRRAVLWAVVLVVAGLTAATSVWYLWREFAAGSFRVTVTRSHHHLHG